MKSPKNCTGIEDIRRAIDALDREIVGLIGRRARYVEAAARFKTGESSVRASERQQAMLRERKIWAEEENLDPDMIEKMYRDLVSYFVNHEMKQWRNTR